MRKTKIAIAAPFEGKPKINLADRYGASPNKPILLKIPATGKRPLAYSAKNLPEGLELENGIISGKVLQQGEYSVTLIVENELGKDEKELIFEIYKDKLLLTPLMGFTSWNAFGEDVSQEKMIGIAEKMTELGICEYGYSYINTDSGWQKEYGGSYDAIMPNEKFPDMKAMTDKIHAMGLKCGIYSTPMLTAWGCPKELESIPGCTCGEPDIRFADTNGGIGTIRKERNNALQWEEWGFDYLKYDWKPADPYNAELMRKELIQTGRDFGFCVTVSALPEYHNYWEKFCNSYRCNCDAYGSWENLLSIYKTYEKFVDYVNKGHYFDLDMLDVGTGDLEYADFSLSEDEKLVSYSMRAFLGAPLQISSNLKHVDEFELSMYCNEEIIAINQDCRFDTARLFWLIEKDDSMIHGYKKKLLNGDYAVALFNFGEKTEEVTVYLDECSRIRDVWAKENMGDSDRISVGLYPHTVRIFRISK